MHKHCLLTALLFVAPSACLVLQPRITRIGGHPPQCAGPSDIKHPSGKHLRDLPIGHSDGNIFLAEGPSSQMISSLYQLDRKENLTSTLLSLNLLCPWLPRLLTWTNVAGLPALAFPPQDLTDLCTYPIKLALRLEVLILNMESPPVSSLSSHLMHHSGLLRTIWPS